MSNELKEIFASYAEVRNTQYVKQIQTVLEHGKLHVMGRVVNAENKDLCWEAVCEYRGLMNAINALKRLEQECEEGLKNGTGS